MPRVKIDYIVSFSNEDPDNPASNLLAMEISKKKWLCTAGESSCSVVLGLSRAVRISSLQVCAYHAAFVEVLVGRSEAPDSFKVAVARSTFLSPSESRRAAAGGAGGGAGGAAGGGAGGAAAERVRSFGAAQLEAEARAQRWDRVRVVCSQPYDKRCKYGLSFIHIFESGDEGVGSLPRPFSVETRSSDEEEDFRPGELFAERFKSSASDKVTVRLPQSTDAQIRRAGSKALKDAPESEIRLVKTSLTRTTPKPREDGPERGDGANGRNNNLLHVEEDYRPRSEIDAVVNEHNDEKKKRERASSSSKTVPETATEGKGGRDDDTETKLVKKDGNDGASTKITADGRSERVTVEAERDRGRNEGESDGRRRAPRAGSGARASGARRPPPPLAGVVFAISGYQNPRRERLRALGLALGARFRRDWGPDCTHLVCAFPNTPKLRALRAAEAAAAAPGARAAAVARGEWLEECARRRRALPWRRFATEPRLLEAAPDSGSDSDGPARDPRGPADASPAESDTDDEIERVQRGRAAAALGASRESDVEFVRDERMRGDVTVSDSDSDTEPEPAAEAEAAAAGAGLPAPLEGYAVALGADAARAGLGEALRRYVRAYGGDLLEMATLDEDSEVSVVLCASRADAARARARGAGRGARGGARAVRADWLWRCHRERRLVPVDEYAL